MAVVGIGLGIFVWLLVGAITGQVVCYPDREAGILPGLVAGIWTVWPFFHTAGVQRYNFLHPIPKEYKVLLKQAFKTIRTFLADTTYDFGDKWSVTTASTTENYIKASLRFSEEEMHIEAGSRPGEVHTRKQRVQRLLEMEIQFKDTGSGTIVQFDFHPKAEGANFSACDSYVRGVLARVEADLGAGVERGKAVDTTLPAPPWWLIGLGALGVPNLASSVLKAVFG